MRNRRAPGLRAADAERAVKSRFAMDTIEAAPATPAAPVWPFGNLARASIEYLARLAADEVGSQLASPRGKRRRGTRALLEHLSSSRDGPGRNAGMPAVWTPAITPCTNVEERYTGLRALLEAARATPLGETFTHDGRTYSRMNARPDQRHHDDPQFPLVRPRPGDRQVRALSDEEETAFWEWAYVEVLRHTGVRIEELVELAHTSIRQYQRPNGEVIALLVIAPSKTNRERVIPMSTSLPRAIATGLGPLTLDGQPRGHG